MPIPMTRDLRKLEILAAFDRETLGDWKGISVMARRFGVSRQWVAMLLRAERGEEYAKRRHPSRGQRRVG
jgi:hypothetical protein